MSNSQSQVSVEALFKPFHTKNLETSNRIVMAPMTRGYSPQGIPGEDVAAYYRRRAENGVGLIVTEGTLINHPSASANPNWPNFFGSEALEGWSKVVDAVHQVGGKIIPQLWHVGIVRPIGSEPNPESLPVGPSGLSLSGEKITEPLTENEIESLISAYAQAAADAARLGFDGVEIHGAHGYLIDQFFWEQTNRRTDRYGGSIAGRTTFAVEVIKACRQAVGPDFPIVLRYSQWKADHYNAKLAESEKQLAEFLSPLVDAGVDIFHCSTRRYWEPEFEGSSLNLAGWTKKLTGKPTITVGSVGLESDFTGIGWTASETTPIHRLIEKLENDEFDLVAVGRALLANPAWAKQIRDKRTDEIKAYDQSILKSLY